MIYIWKSVSYLDQYGPGFCVAQGETLSAAIRKAVLQFLSSPEEEGMFTLDVPADQFLSEVRILKETVRIGGQITDLHPERHEDVISFWTSLLEADVEALYDGTSFAFMRAGSS